MKNSIGENIKRCRERQGMSVDKVARMLGVPAETVEKWEAGREIPGEESVVLIARLFGVPEDEFKKAPVENCRDDESGKGKEHAGTVDSGAEDKPDAENYSGEWERGNTEAQDFEKSPLFRYMDPDEKLIWFGRPTGEHVGGRWDINLRTFFIGIIFTVFAFVWSVTALRSSGILGIFGLLFVAVGIYTSFGRWIILYTNKKNTYYAVTGRRILLCITGQTVRFREIRYSRISDVQLIKSKRGTGCGTIVFNVPNFVPEYPYGKYSDRISNNNQLLDSFIDIADAERVYRLINEAKTAYPGE